MQQHPGAGGDDGALLEAQLRLLADSYRSPARAAASKGRISAMHDDHEHDAVGSARLRWLSSSPDMFEEFPELVSMACVSAVRFLRGKASAGWSSCAQVRLKARRHHDFPSSLLCDALCRIRLLRAQHAFAQAATRPSVGELLHRS